MRINCWDGACNSAAATAGEVSGVTAGAAGNMLGVLAAGAGSCALCQLADSQPSAAAASVQQEQCGISCSTCVLLATAAGRFTCEVC